MRRPLGLTATILALLLAASCTSGGGTRPEGGEPSSSPAPPFPSPAPAEPTLAPDALSVHPCPDAPRDRCGTAAVPVRWDRLEDGETIAVRFRIFTRSDADAAPREPIVAFEGGPGYGSIGSAGSYRFLFGPLLRTRDLILMDQRGTGGSGAIECTGLQRGLGEYSSAAGDCADALGANVNAYGSAAAADDLAAILLALDVPEVVVYGDSYGTYLAQTFAIRHPDRTRAVVLDGAYDDSFDPFARDAAAALRRSWATLCHRAGTCPGIVHDIGQLARELNRSSLVGAGVDAAGDRSAIRLTDEALAQLLYDATYVFTIYRDFPAALAALRRGDPAPLLRLAAEDLVTTGGGGNPRAYSEGAYMAISSTTTRRSGIARFPPQSAARSSTPRSASWRPTPSRRSRTRRGSDRCTSTSWSSAASNGRRSTPRTRPRRLPRRTPTSRSSS